MKRHLRILFLLAGSLILTYVMFAFAQEQTDISVAPKKESEVLWLYGHVVSVDVQKKEIQVKFFDYETDTDKEITVAVDDKTAYENAASFNELKPDATVSIDYTLLAEGRALAKNISVERPEAASVQPATEEPAREDTNIMPTEQPAQQTPPADQQETPAPEQSAPPVTNTTSAN